jgi:hypothetical protein
VREKFRDRARAHEVDFRIVGRNCNCRTGGAQCLKVNDKRHFAESGVQLMVSSDDSAEGHQTGATLVQHGTRMAANGDLRLTPSPGGIEDNPDLGPGNGRRSARCARGGGRGTTNFMFLALAADRLYRNDAQQESK